MGSWQTNTCPASPRRPRRLPELRRKQCHSHHQREWQILGTSCALTVSIKELPVKGWTQYIHPRIWHGIIWTSAEAQILPFVRAHMSYLIPSPLCFSAALNHYRRFKSLLCEASCFAIPATCKSVLSVKARAAEENGEGIQGLSSGGLTETSRNSCQCK